MIVKLRRAGPKGACWLLTRQSDRQPEWLEQCAGLDELVPTGLAWVDADFSLGRWMVRRLVATPLPAAEAPIVSSKPRGRRFRIIASA
jgi:hypothetical protein